MAPTATATNGDALADGRQGKRVDAYTKFWQKDLNKEQEVDNQNRLDSYTDVVNGQLTTSQPYVSLLTQMIFSCT